MFEFVPYAPELAQQWDEIIDQADNGHFLFKRSYLEYHADRFADSSFVLRQKDRIVGVIPGNRSDAKWVSHGGLTFGGVFLSPKLNRIGVLQEIYKQLWDELRVRDITHAFIKPVPWIYHRVPSEGDLYVLNCNGQAECLIEVSTAVDLHASPKPSDLRKRSRKRAVSAGLVVEESNNYEGFWAILSARLSDKYDRNPVHSCDEIKLLKSRFADEIRLFVVRDAEENICGGTVIFETFRVAHAQYISASDQGMEQGALDLLFFTLIDRYRNAGKDYFDFGISTEDNGRVLNESLAAFKEGFGGRSIVHHKFQLKI
ncbi:GNAT family N-acetyltransferase [Thalassospira alkalitolerans]|uniref:BioF2-like acetyltransferase domain-containing protein n=1 Tax=Thalassospira alkalitolerans TaxID=1293890 RepID=A0A1Y2LCA2_9PROT|nr:GNAT family N-acetyltransferase [Thalassospira alkalitolerans]OSQ48368.1 hypothetical protein TALK_08845 [Thalassospira alkalitolerans]